MNNVVILSICIPTRNRLSSLKNSINSIIEQEFFKKNDFVELVISDNCSTDGTSDYLNQLTLAHRGKIKAVRNETNIGDKNFESVLRVASGAFRKLANDSLIWAPGSVETMVEYVRAASGSKPTLFFANGHARTSELVTLTKTPDEFLEAVSFYSTWIGAFGIWANQLDSFSKVGYTIVSSDSPALVQTELLIELVRQNSHCIVVNTPFAAVHLSSRKGEYSVAKVFGDVYPRLLLESGIFSDEVITQEKRRVLEEHILPVYFDGKLDFYKHPLEAHLPLYQYEPYFKLSVAKARNVFFSSFTDKWREMNSHNETTVRSYFEPHLVSVARYSYGPLNVQSWGSQGEGLTIGSYVSIANDVTFCLGGNHPYSGLSTYPFKVKFFGLSLEAQTKGRIVVCDDVWIGQKVVIMSGVTIGQGAIIGAGSVVTRNVPPYAIVVGNPGRVIKFRFSDDIIQKLITVDFSKLDRDDCVALGEAFLYEEIDKCNVDELIKMLPRKGTG